MMRLRPFVSILTLAVWLLAAPVRAIGPIAQRLLDGISRLEEKYRPAVPPRQPVLSLDQLYPRIAEAAPRFVANAENIGRELGAPVIAPRQLKSRQLVEQILRSSSRQPAEILDVSRATVLVEYDQMDAALEAVAAAFGRENIVGISDLVNHPLEDGFRGDVSLSIRDPKTGTIHELLLMPPAIWKPIVEGEHEHFERNRALKMKIRSEQRAPTETERQSIERMSAETTAIYEHAMAVALRSAVDRVQRREGHVCFADWSIAGRRRPLPR